MQHIPYGRQSISLEDIQQVVDVLKSDWLTQGPTIARFEQTVADYCGAAYAVAVNSATSGLHLACLVLGVGKGDILWTVPNTFVASANCARYCGAEVDFVDISPATFAMCPDALVCKLEMAEKTGKLPKVVIPVHFAGQSCEMDRIAELSKRYGFRIIEDAAHAIGGRYRDTAVGSCRYSDMTVFSFHPVKIITTGEGGMVLTNDEAIYQRLLRLRNHGIIRNEALMSQPAPGPWYYQQVELGFNYRMTDIQAALGLSQMQRLDTFVQVRHRLAQIYDAALADLPIMPQRQHPDAFSACHLYAVRLQSHMPIDRRSVFEALRQAGIGVQVHYIPVHTQPYYQTLGFRWGDYPEAEAYYREAFSLPLYTDLTDEEQAYVIKTLRRILLTPETDLTLTAHQA